MKKATFSMAILLIASLGTPVSLAGKANAPSDPKNYPIQQNDDFIADCEALGFNVGPDWGLYMYSDREEEDAGFNWSHKVDEYKEAGILNFPRNSKRLFYKIYANQPITPSFFESCVRHCNAATMVFLESEVMAMTGLSEVFTLNV